MSANPIREDAVISATFELGVRPILSFVFGKDKDVTIYSAYRDTSGVEIARIDPMSSLYLVEPLLILLRTDVTVQFALGTVRNCYQHCLWCYTKQDNCLTTRDAQTVAVGSAADVALKVIELISQYHNWIPDL